MRGSALYELHARRESSVDGHGLLMTHLVEVVDLRQDAEEEPGGVEVEDEEAQAHARV